MLDAPEEPPQLQMSIRAKMAKNQVHYFDKNKIEVTIEMW